MELLCTDNTGVCQTTPCQTASVDGKLTSRMLIASMLPVTFVVVMVFSFLSAANHQGNIVPLNIVNSFCGISSLCVIVNMPLAEVQKGISIPCTESSLYMALRG